MHTTALFLFFFSIIFVIKGQTDFEAQLDAFIANTYLPSAQIPGLGIALLNDTQVFTKGYGFRNLSENAPVDENTLFCIGSVTKSVLATLTVKLLHEKHPELGESVLEVPIARLAPTFNFTLSDRYRAESVTFRDVLAHKLCLHQPDLSLLVGAVNSSSEFAYRLRYEPQVCPFRYSFVYRNAFFGFLGEALGHVMDEKIEDLLKNFMEEIGMSNATLIAHDNSHLDAPNLSQGYYWRNGTSSPLNMKLLSRIAVAPGAGVILATMKDMIKFLELHVEKGKVDGKQVIPEEAMSWLYTLSSVPAEFNGDKNQETDGVYGVYGYGLGFTLALYDGWKTYQHGGFYPPYRSLITIFPKKRVAVFSSSNQLEANNAFPQSVVHSFIFETLRGNQVNPSTTTAILREPNAETIDQSPILPLHVKPNNNHSFYAKQRQQKDPAMIVGAYGSALEGDLLIEYDNITTQLSIHYGEWGHGILEPLNLNTTDSYVVHWETDINQHFYANGPVTPEFYVDFPNDETLNIRISEGVIGTFLKYASLTRFPAIPWEEGSCGADTKAHP
ncbi:unnamed protein product [Orchesella dallaii]|uniref:Beta-lactamase-related domain-containing protein n=1 Tax=Orchesella dallaii TaxID=48710 RepID=A0ABP1RWG5_9HEXA